MTQGRFVRFGMLAALALSLGVGGCGRKSGLNLPPAAQASAQPGQSSAPAAAPAPSLAGSIMPGDDTNAVGYDNGVAIGADGRPIAPPGQKKRILLDRLLD